MAVVVNFLIACVTVVVLGILFFQVLPRLCPKIRDVLPSQNTITYIQILPPTLGFPVMLCLFFTVYLPYNVDQPFKTARGWTHILFVLFLWSNVMFNYLSTVAISPGYPQHRDEYIRNRNFVKTYEMCVKCNRVRSFGTHHCSWCHTCVEMMCHHCPFTNNCIGLRNYVYYYSFLVYLFLMLVYSSYITFSLFAKCVSAVAMQFVYNTFSINTDIHRLHRYTTDTPLAKLGLHHSPEVCEEFDDYPLLFAPAIVMCFFIGLLLTYHSFLLLADMSVVDLFDTITNATSVREFLRILYVSILKRKKTRFINLVYRQKSRWWKFLVPSFIDVHNQVPLKDM